MASEYPDAGLELAEDFRKLGAEAERIVLSREQADTEAAARRLDGVTGIWFGGGDQAKLTAAIGHTRVETAIHARYAAGAVVGGTSAGAAVMSTPMITGDERKPGGSRPPAKDSSDAFMTIAREDVVTIDGFGMLPGVIIDQHHVRRRRGNRLVSVVLEHPELVGIGIDGVDGARGRAVRALEGDRRAPRSSMTRAAGENHAGPAPILGTTGGQARWCRPGGTYD